MVDLVENVFKMLKFLPSNYAIVLIAHGSFSYTKAHDELKEFSEKMNQPVPIYCRTLYGDITLEMTWINFRMNMMNLL